MKLLSRGFSMLFCRSFTQSERFFQTAQFIIALHSCSHFKLHSHVDEKRVRARAQVRCSDFVGSDFPHSLSMFDKLLHLSKSESFAMSCSRRCDLCEAISNLLTVSTCSFKIRCPMFHRPDLHKGDLLVHVASASTCTLAFHESQSC